jgi:hypothetical protein
MGAPSRNSPPTVYALCLVMFIVFYGVALSMLEDQMVTLFLGAAAMWITQRKLLNRSAYDARE